MIKISNLDFGYTNRQRLFRGINLDLPEGSIVGLLGRNGEGKSTLMRLISGVLLAKAGTVEVLGYSVAEREVGLLQQIYLLPEEVKLPKMSIRTYFSVFAPFYPTYDAALANELIKEFDLEWDMQLDRISLGQRKKSAIALALALRTPLLLLDEPTNGLDIPSKSVFRRILARYIGEHQTVIISTHQVRDLEQLIDSLLILDENQIVCNERISTLSSCFGFGAVEPSIEGRIVYREPAMMGEFAVYKQIEGEEDDSAFSMELFFNAMIAQRALMQGHISQYKQTMR